MITKSDSLVRWDPFARGGYQRWTLSGDDRPRGGCGWCGSRKARLYVYVWDSGSMLRSPSVYDSRRAFCDFGCFNSYHR